jgi:ABC-2 type transport system permease protein
MSSFARSISNTYTIARRELGAYFVSPVAYVLIAFQFGICSYVLSIILGFEEAMPVYAEGMGGRVGGAVPGLYFWLWFAALLALPALTMRLFAEEKRSGTIEQLICNPVRDSEIVFGKYAAALAVFGIMMALSLLYPFWIHKFSEQEWPQLISGLLSVLGKGCLFLAVGLFISSLTKSQVTAFLFTLGALLFLWLIGITAESAEGTKVGALLEYISMERVSEDLIKGVLDVRALVYFVSLTAFFLFATVRSLAGHRAQ